jgi:hypothetical protein
LLHRDIHQKSGGPNSFHSILNTLIPEQAADFARAYPNGLSPAEAKQKLAQAYRQWAAANVGEIGSSANDAAASAEAIIKAADAWIDVPRP